MSPLQASTSQGRSNLFHCGPIDGTNQNPVISVSCVPENSSERPLYSYDSQYFLSRVILIWTTVSLSEFPKTSDQDIMELFNITDRSREPTALQFAISKDLINDCSVMKESRFVETVRNMERLVSTTTHCQFQQLYHLGQKLQDNRTYQHNLFKAP
jgi:hypothetical protein